MTEAELELLRATQEVRIETSRAEDSPVHRTTLQLLPA
jgi:hypothetical protein